MYIHLGNRKIISDKKYIGIFNSDTLKMSEKNDWITKELKKDDRSVAISRENDFISSSVSPFTVIKRISYKSDCIWSKEK